MLLFLIIPFIIACFHKYRVKELFKVTDMYPYFIVNAVHIFFIINIFFKNYYFVKYSEVLQYLNILVLLYPIIRRRLYKPALIGSALVICGTLMNKLIIYVNSGKMPVYPTLSALTGYCDKSMLAGDVDSLHVLMTSETHLNLLGDYIDIGFCILSPGDVLIHLFGSVILYYTIKAVHFEQKN